MGLSKKRLCGSPVLAFNNFSFSYNLRWKSSAQISSRQSIRNHRREAVSVTLEAVERSDILTLRGEILFCEILIWLFQVKELPDLMTLVVGRGESSAEILF